MLRPELDGLRIKIENINDDKIYFVDRGMARHIANPQVYNGMFRDGNGIWTFKFSHNDMINIGKQITNEMAIFHWGPDMYFADIGDKQGQDCRHILDPQTMDRCHFKTDVSQPSKNPQDDPFRLWAPLKWIPKFNGNRVKTAGKDATYLIDQGKKRQIRDPATYTALFGNGDRPQIVDNLDDIPNGGDMYNAGTMLVTAPDQPGGAKTYLLDNMRKRLIVDGNALTYYGFVGGRVTRMTWGQLFEYPDGDPIAWPAQNIAVQ